MHSSTGLIKGLLLLIVQVILPLIITLVVTLILKNSPHVLSSKKLVWEPLLIGSLFTIIFAYLTTYFSVKNELCHLDQITLVTPALATIIFLIWARIYTIPWWGYIFGILFFLLASIALGKIIYSHIRTKIRVDILEDTGKIYGDEDLSKHEKEYLSDFIDFSTVDKKTKKKKGIKNIFKKK